VIEVEIFGPRLTLLQTIRLSLRILFLLWILLLFWQKPWTPPPVWPLFSWLKWLI